jgi:uncharacterized protein YjbI with pentapeptide repeats
MVSQPHIIIGLHTTIYSPLYIVVDLTDADLSGSTLSNADLSGSTLSNADLTNSSLTDAILFNADLTNADLRDSDLTNADLTLTRLNGSIFNCESENCRSYRQYESDPYS